MRIGFCLGVKPLFGFVDTTFLHICSDPAVRTPFGVYLVCVPSTLVSDRLYRSSYLPYQKLRPDARTHSQIKRPSANHRPRRPFIVHGGEHRRDGYEDADTRALVRAAAQN